MIRVPRYCPQSTCERVAKILLNLKIEDYANAPGVKKISDIGMAFFETIDDPSLRSQYYEQVQSSMEIIREIFHPEKSPIDQLRLELDEQWGPGARLLRLEKNRPLFSGLVRILNDGALPHEDKLERDFGCKKEDIGYVSQLAVNIYLQTPKFGGDLVLYEESLPDEEYDRLRGNCYGIDPRKLPQPKLTFKPDAGDLVIFNPRKLHAVKKSTNQDISRVSYSTFLFFGGEDQPIQFWS